MTVGTKRINQGRMSWSMVNFVCQFGLPAEAEKYWYMVEWIASEPGKPDKRFNTSKETSDKLDNLEIKEVNFVRTYKLHMGIYVRTFFIFRRLNVLVFINLLVTATAFDTYIVLI